MFTDGVVFAFERHLRHARRSLFTAMLLSSIGVRIAGKIRTYETGMASATLARWRLHDLPLASGEEKVIGRYFSVPPRLCACSHFVGSPVSGIRP